MTSRELVKSSLHFTGVDRLPFDLCQPYGSDFIYVGVDPHPNQINNWDMTIKEWTDEWGSCWKRLGSTLLGEVQNIVLEDYGKLHELKIPDISQPSRWKTIENLSAYRGDFYVLASGESLYFRATFLRGSENIWADIYENPEGLCALVDILCDYNIELVRKFASYGADGYFMLDDWGLQNTLQISPAKWREIWKPRYERIFSEARALGMDLFLHSCGYIVDILDDFIEIGLNAIHMDQHENMGLELLGRRFREKINFFAPVDIQKTMCTGSIEEIRAYCREMARYFHTPKGGFIPRWYTDPVGAGHRQEALDAMCEEFMKISHELYGK